MLTNFHTHTFRCGHAQGTPADYVAQAIRDNADCLGFSDHCPFPHDEIDTWSEIRMSPEEMPSYLEDVRRAAKTAPFPVYAGFECEWSSRYASWYTDVLLGEQGAEYLILGAHWLSRGRKNVYAPRLADADSIRDYFSQTLEGIGSGLFRILAHPELIMADGLGWNRELAAGFADIIDAAMAQNMPLEINGYGLIKPPVQTAQGMRLQYPVDEFWRLAAQKGAKVICNSDAHTPDYVMRGAVNARNYAAKFSLDVVETIF
ncbi:MAG: histidinol-phosphatase [Treponema sp.]|jgi:histidinol-phosphatase (PHP family)|nr:histidinol-phosphatase [Treponema sp.]